MSAWPEKRGKYWRVRYHRDDGTIGSLSDRYSKTEAKTVAAEISSQQRKGIFLDPARGEATIAELRDDAWGRMTVGENRRAALDSAWRTWVEPRWGGVQVRDVEPVAVHDWLAGIARERGQRTVEAARQCLSKILDFAVWDRRIPLNPAKVPAPGGAPKSTQPARDKIWPSPLEALQVATNAYWLHGHWAYVMLLTYAYTGARWGEIAGLRTVDVNLAGATLTVNETLREVGGRLSGGDGKNPSALRTVELPAFLVAEFAVLLPTRDGLIFTDSVGGPWRRSNFGRRILDPAADGRPAAPAVKGHAARPEIPPVLPGLTVHGFRHGHNSWLIADGIPEIGRAERMGWKIGDRVQQVYSHAAPEVRARILDALDTRWAESVRQFRKISGSRLPRCCMVATPRRR